MLWPQLFDSESNKWLVICQAVTLCRNLILLPLGHHFNSGIVFIEPLALLSGETLVHASNRNHYPLYLQHVYISKGFYPLKRKSVFVVKVLAQLFAALEIVTITAMD